MWVLRVEVFLADVILRAAAVVVGAGWTVLAIRDILRFRRKHGRWPGWGD